MMDMQPKIVSCGVGAGLGVQFGSALAVLTGSVLKRHYGIELNEIEATALATIMVTPCAILCALIGGYLRTEKKYNPQPSG
jgi:hypothetical protein